MGEHFPGSGGAHAYCSSAKGNLKREIKVQNIPRDSAEHREGNSDAQEMGDRRTQRQPLGIGRGMGHRLIPSGGVSGVRVMEAGRGRKGILDRRTPVSVRDLGVG